MSTWRRSDWTLLLLAALCIMAVWEGIAVNNWPSTRGCGGDFPQYYVAGTILGRGEGARLYDQPYFQHFQASMRDDPLPSLYPPSFGLAMVPLARLPYREALAAWWAIQAICIVAAGLIFYRTVPLPQPWRINMLAALAALTPLWIAVGIGQVGPMVLLIMTAGVTLHKRDKGLWAGLLFSILAFKPQLAAGIVFWMLIRRDYRTLLGLGAGFSIQFLAVAAYAGPCVWFDYLHAMPVIATMTRRAHFSPMMEASFVGMASNLLWSVGWTAWETVAMKAAYAITVSAAAVMLCRVVWSRRPLLAAERPPASPWAEFPGRTGSPSYKQPPASPGAENYEYACGVIFMMILPPYLIMYDQTLLAIPLVMLWSSPVWRWGVVLFATTTVLVVNLSLVLGFSLTSCMALATMFILTRATRRLDGVAPAFAR